MNTCKKCAGTGYVQGHHKPGYVHYETDAGEPCPSYHFEQVPCDCKTISQLEQANATLRDVLERSAQYVALHAQDGSSAAGLYTEIQKILGVERR